MVIMTLLILNSKSPYSLCVYHHQNKRVQKLRIRQNTLRRNVYSATFAPFLKAYLKWMGTRAFYKNNKLHDNFTSLPSGFNNIFHIKIIINILLNM